MAGQGYSKPKIDRIDGILLSKPIIRNLATGTSVAFLQLRQTDGAATVASLRLGADEESRRPVREMESGDRIVLEGSWDIAADRADSDARAFRALRIASRESRAAMRPITPAPYHPSTRIEAFWLAITGRRAWIVDRRGADDDPVPPRAFAAPIDPTMVAPIVAPQAHRPTTTAKTITPGSKSATAQVEGELTSEPTLSADGTIALSVRERGGWKNIANIVFDPEAAGMPAAAVAALASQHTGSRIRVAGRWRKRNDGYFLTATFATSDAIAASYAATGEVAPAMPDIRPRPKRMRPRDDVEIRCSEEANPDLSIRGDRDGQTLETAAGFGGPGRTRDDRREAGGSSSMLASDLCGGKRARVDRNRPPGQP